MARDSHVGMPYIQRKLGELVGHEVTYDSARRYTHRVGFPRQVYSRALMHEYGQVQRLWWKHRVDAFMQRYGYTPAALDHYEKQVRNLRRSLAQIRSRMEQRKLED
jgi:hypothetical protein